MFFERRCPGCRSVAAGVCARCRASLRPAPAHLSIDGLDALVAWCRYEGAGREAVLALKHRGRRDLCRWLADDLAALAPPVEVVTWVPASPGGRRERGYDQGAVLARGVARRLGRPALPLLRRPRRSTSQRGRSKQQRWEGVTFQGRRQVSGRVLLVDDVVTTGSSLSHAAVTLRQAGASGVTGLVVAVADRDR